METGDASGTSAAVPLIRQLSRREYEVLDQIQMGLTNRQIAERLFVSCNTVNKHVQQVLRKLAVSNRVQAAVYLRGGEALRAGSGDGRPNPTSPG
jgi:DNA-binding NarL/FixJ family response regulator